MRKKNWKAHNERGASMIEFALLIALIAILSIVALEAFGKEVSASFSNSATKVSTAMAGDFQDSEENNNSCTPDTPGFPNC